MYDDDKDNYVIGIIMARYSLKSGMKRFGIKEGGGGDVTDELSQLHDKEKIPVGTKTIT